MWKIIMMNLQKVK